MQKFTSVHFEILTGESASMRPPRISFNGFELELERESGGTGVGETFVGSYEINSVPHTVRLLGPGDDARWQIERITVQYVGQGVETRRFEAVELIGDASLDVWEEAAPGFEV